MEFKKHFEPETNNIIITMLPEERLFVVFFFFKTCQNVVRMFPVSLESSKLCIKFISRIVDLTSLYFRKTLPYTAHKKQNCDCLVNMSVTDASFLGQMKLQSGRD